jgi:hypothetical protein
VVRYDTRLWECVTGLFAPAKHRGCVRCVVTVPTALCPWRSFARGGIVTAALYRQAQKVAKLREFVAVVDVTAKELQQEAQDLGDVPEEFLGAKAAHPPPRVR